jgi:glycogen debranching enzyme
MAEIFQALGKPDRAGELRAKAAKLFEQFNEAFWDEELGFYALALDGNKKKVLTVLRTPGIACGPASCRGNARRRWWSA